MKKYDSYKDSGVQWIGEIPSHWELIRGKYSTRIISGFPFDSNLFTYEEDENYMPLIRIRDIANTSTEIRYKGSYPLDSIVHNGEVLIGMDGDFNISCWKGKDALLNQRVCKILGTNVLRLSYVYYMLQFPLKCINDITYSTTVKHLSTFDIFESYLPIPPIVEQITIAAYLNKKCGEIDKAIATQQKRIELLQELRQNIITHAVTRGINPDTPLKDSGVEWIGMVPEHWEVMKMNHALRSITDVNHYMPDSVLEGYPYIMTGDLKEYLSAIDFESCKQISEYDYKELSIKSKAEKGDVIFARYATIGTVCYVDIDRDFIVSYSCVTIKPNSKKLEGLFLFYYLQSHTFFEDVSQSINSNTQGNVGIESLSASRIIVPPKAEQLAIITYIEAETAKIDKQVAKANRQISLLQELKQSIITEVVTGKRKVC